MVTRKQKTVPKRVVWRITPNAPMGEWVDANAPVQKAGPTDAIEGGSSNWVASSFDLLRGSEVNDDPATQPDTLWDDFFGPASGPVPPDPDK